MSACLSDYADVESVRQYCLCLQLARNRVPSVPATSYERAYFRSKWTRASVTMRMLNALTDMLIYYKPADCLSDKCINLEILMQALTSMFVDSVEQ
jgi:hypothetical protein